MLSSCRVRVADSPRSTASGRSLTSSSDSSKSSGDLQLAYGLQNAAQAIVIKMEVERGTLSRHPNFGLVNVKGELTNNTQGLQAMLSRSITQQVESDPRFERLEQITVQYISDLHGFKIYLQARLSGSQAVIPISFSVNL